mmetsp:Transcript_34141/g.50168  ORF Transcript_34141/g.50168 Transcript_34141/m.50168 type:complete len:211 (+) Transcript_34141:92-724(+)|eukprot:CAMPEP_0195517374 /NCGR_PEP_ID=MMETSP0794_2-20130614/10590_1 /TAXON_ID=515487 /ORGANISM="Stephanopyxis turris, Strain CCMP 815" /LENGTH=210 /DNA_ID=CAMNT_0040646165 /DNA_START=91 /DNA_END=723 /DNA_ORIENTATION=+
MKVACLFALATTASAFQPQMQTQRTTVAMSAESSRREMFGLIGAAAAAIPAAASASAGDSPRFSVFGLVGDGTSYSEGAAYGSDQDHPTYSPYSVYDKAGDKSVYKPGNDEAIARKKAIIAESKVRLGKLDKYIEKKEWFNVKDELTRYMYETRGAVRGLATTPTQKEIADEFFVAIEKTYGSATQRKQAACAAAAAESIAKLDKFTASL